MKQTHKSCGDRLWMGTVEKDVLLIWYVSKL